MENTKNTFKRFIFTIGVIALSITSTGILSVPIAFAAAPGVGATLTGTAQALTVGTSTAINGFTVKEADAFEITAANDIRIKIPATTGVIWDTTDTTATIGGSAAAKVSGTVSYADSGKTLILNVTTDFDTNNETVVVSALSYVPIYASAAAPLTWSIDGAGATFAVGNVNTNLTVSAADAAGAVTVAGNSVTGVAGLTTLSLSIPVEMGNTDTITFTMPANFTVTGGSLAPITGTATNVGCVGVAATRVVTCTTTGVSGTGARTIIMSGITGAYVGAIGNISNLVVTDTGNGITASDTTVATPATTVGALATTNVQPATLVKGASSTSTISFTTAAPIPNLGKIKVTYPAGYVLTDLTSFAGLPEGVASGLSGLDGTWNATVSGQIVTFIQVGGAASAPGAKSLQIGFVRNPATAGAGGTYTILTTNSANDSIETDAAVATDSFINGTSSSSSPTPAPTPAPTPSASPAPATTPAAGPTPLTAAIDLPDTGIIATESLLQASANASVLIPAATKATDADGKPYTSTIAPPVAIAANLLPAALPADLTFSSAVDIKTDKPVTFDKPVTVTLPLPADVNLKKNLQIYYYDTVTKKYILAGTAKVSADGKSISVPVTHLTTFVVVEAPVTVTPPAATKDPGFTDTKGHWAVEYINKLYNMGVVKGKTETSFAPDDKITRAEMVKIAVLTFGGVPKDGDMPTYKDVKADDWFASYLAIAETAKVIDTATEFRPNDPITRAEALKILLVASGKDLKGAASATFTDVKASDWFVSYVNFAFAKMIVSGKTETMFAPGDNITRAELAKMAVKTSELQ